MLLLYMFIYVYICLNIHTHTHTYTYIYIHTHTHTHMYICIYIYTHTHTHTYIPHENNKSSGFLMFSVSIEQTSDMKWVTAKIKFPLNTCYTHNATDKIFLSIFSLPEPIVRNFHVYQCFSETSLGIVAELYFYSR